ncbi:MAG TPA: VOC family protein [Solirubrobacter sp.]|nr:VOC family protein [Solirubrobacter sp.]
MTTETIHPAVRVGHVHLRVADLDRSLAFYRDALGFGLTVDARGAGIPMTLLAAGDYHHHIGLNTFADPGLYDVAFVYPDRHELGRAAERLRDRGYAISHATDHGATVSVYLDDPDGNGIELYCDRPCETWFDDAGRPILRNDRIPVESLREEHVG